MIGRFLRDMAARLARGEGGAAAAEFALVLPLLVLMTLGAIGAGMMMSAAMALNFAAQDAARCASVNSVCSTQSGVSARGTSKYVGPTLTGMSFTLNAAAACGRQVVGAGTYSLRTGLATVSVPISSTACYPAQS